MRILARFDVARHVIRRVAGADARRAAVITLAVAILSAAGAVVFPADGVAEQPENGCWVRLYDEENFRGEVLALVGPVEIHNSRVGGWSRGRTFRSLAVGPRASVILYDAVSFADRTMSFGPGQRVRELSEAMGYFENVNSLKIKCG